MKEYNKPEINFTALHSEAIMAPSGGINVNSGNFTKITDNQYSEIKY